MYFLESDVMSILMWIALGLMSGGIVHLLDSGSVKGGMLGTISLGIAGSVVGGIIASMLFGGAPIIFSLQGIAIAVTSALVLAGAHRFSLRQHDYFRTMFRKG